MSCWRSVYTKPSPSRPPAHYHPYQEERFEVLSGKVNVAVDGEVRDLGDGPEPIPQKRLTAEMLLCAIRAATENVRVRERAAVLGERYRPSGASRGRSRL